MQSVGNADSRQMFLMRKTSLQGMSDAQLFTYCRPSRANRGSSHRNAAQAYALSKARRASCGRPVRERHAASESMAARASPDSDSASARSVAASTPMFVSSVSETICASARSAPP